MSRLRVLLALALLSIGLAFVVDKTNVLARMFMRLDMPDRAYAFFQEKENRAVSAYRAGHFDQAAIEFEALGDEWRFNQANALALQGRYGDALILYDAILEAQPDHQSAKFNHALVSRVFAGTKLDGVPIPMELKDRNIAANAPVGMGNARAQGSGAEANNLGTSFETPQLQEEGVRRVSRTFDDKYIAASERWIKTLEDEPAKYLKARLLAEYKRKKANGTGPEPSDDTQ